MELRGQKPYEQWGWEKLRGWIGKLKQEWKYVLGMTEIEKTEHRKTVNAKPIKIGICEEELLTYLTET